VADAYVGEGALACEDVEVLDLGVEALEEGDCVADEAGLLGLGQALGVDAAGAVRERGDAGAGGAKFGVDRRLADEALALDHRERDGSGGGDDGRVARCR
jgi:hypothetical protein